MKKNTHLLKTTIEVLTKKKKNLIGIFKIKAVYGFLKFKCFWNFYNFFEYFKSFNLKIEKKKTYLDLFKLKFVSK